ncbi:endo-1,4-beta-xylanase [Streptomyces sp. CNQ-509]|uniref:endo-1,4-beta-xylanase n=1 Tax=unclassified Streptomyces TaxID=2593676 RepID=UPI00062DCA78|nr:endo-1,4-beta-xylanase [Streptomyces sp. CNQ-509]AKH83023.1 endo-1,4-beta-xylanase [Streptomyces sp. CNQ-509]
MRRLRSRPRALLAALAGALCLYGLGTAAPAQAAAPAEAAGAAGPSATAAASLNELAQAHGKFIGSAAATAHFSDTQYTGILGSEFGQVTAENEMKWDTVESSRGQFNFGPGDRIVDFAQQNGQSIRGHTLVWHNQLPGWVSSLPSGEVRTAMENHVTQVAGHYAGDIDAWDVVNEPFNEDGTFRNSPFYNAMGTDFVAHALRAAKAADPGAKLCINDYNIEGVNAKSTAMYNLVRDLKAQGVPIDCVGIQGHLAIQYGFPNDLRQNMQRFADLGVDVAITELDVRIQLPVSSEKEATQSQYYANVIDACLAVTRCTGVTVWGFPDKYSWVPDVFPGEGSATLWNDSYQPKQAYNAVVEALGGDPGPGPGPGDGCTAAYAVPQQWNGGFTAAVTVSCDGDSLSGWSVSWDYTAGQRVTNAWNATCQQSGTRVTCTNAPYNGTVPDGGSVTFGFNGTWTDTNPTPPTLTLG